MHMTQAALLVLGAMGRRPLMLDEIENLAALLGADPRERAGGKWFVVLKHAGLLEYRDGGYGLTEDGYEFVVLGKWLWE